MKLTLIGNSHLSQFKIENNQKAYMQRYNLKDIQFIYAQGASIRGLANPNSRLGLRNHIEKFIKENSDHFLIYTLGQVDIEFGYYYKCVKTNTQIDVYEYIKELVQIYEQYFKEQNHSNFALLGINPTVITDTKHSFEVNFKNPEVYSVYNNINLTGETNQSIDYE